MRNVSIAAVCISMFAAGWLTRDQPNETQASTKPTPIVSVSIPEIDIPAITADEPSSEPVVETQFVTTSGSVCTSGTCAVNAGTVRRWTPIRNVASRWQSRGRWYPGKNLGRLFGRRR